MIITCLRTLLINMNRFSVICLCVFFLLVDSSLTNETSRLLDGNIVTAVDLLQNIYEECLQAGSFSCVKPKILAFLSTSLSKDKIRLTRDLTIVNSQTASDGEPTSIFNEISKISELGLDNDKKQKLRLLALDKLDGFLYNHELRIRIPKEITHGDLSVFVPQILTKNLPEELKIPLTDGVTHVTGRSRKFLRRVVMPFLIGLKFKATTLIPLAFALIALKTWKALTLALLSVVLSGAMVIFKFTKPKAHYEVIHYPQPVPVYEHHTSHVPHVPHVHEYHAHDFVHTHAHPHGRYLDAQEMAYNRQQI